MNHPDFLENRLRESLGQLFGELDDATFAGVRAFFNWVDLPGGACLFRQGDVGGTSIGAIMGALIARGWKAGTVRSRCHEVFKKNPTGDFNLVPRVSIFKGKKLEALLEENFGRIKSGFRTGRLNFATARKYYRGDF